MTSCCFNGYVVQPQGLEPTRLLCPWDFPGKNTGAGFHVLLQGIFLTGIEPASLALAGGFSTAEPPGKPINWDTGDKTIPILLVLTS